MSYSGYTEYLSEEGFYWTKDCWDDEEKNLGPNNSIPFWCHSVSTTNGYGEQRKYLRLDEEFACYDEDAPKTEIGFEDKWHEDHYGNKYATKILRFSPDKFWTKI